MLSQSLATADYFASVCVQHTITSASALCSSLSFMSRHRLTQLTGCLSPALRAHNAKIGVL